MRLNIFIFLLLILIASCSTETGFPEKKFNRIPLEELKLPIGSNIKNLNESVGTVDFKNLQRYVSQFELKDETFDLKEFEMQWNTFSESNNISKWNEADLEIWVDITGFLLELTGKAKCGEALESISNSSLQQTIAPYILTKRLDHIFVNLFQPVEINYQHSLYGEVKFRQETDYPKSGNVKLYFGMTERRHIELFIRIPSWAEGTAVTVKQVKYFAPPGGYCHIVKKWKEGDLVEIEFPMDKMPR